MLELTVKSNERRHANRSSKAAVQPDDEYSVCSRRCIHAGEQSGAGSEYFQPSRRTTHAQIGSTNHRSLERDAVGALAITTSPRSGALSGASSLGKRARGGDDDEIPTSKVGASRHHQQYGNDSRDNLGLPQSPPSPNISPSPVPADGFGEKQSSPIGLGNANGRNSGSGDTTGVSSGKSVAWSKSSLGNPDMAAVLRR